MKYNSNTLYNDFSANKDRKYLLQNIFCAKIKETVFPESRKDESLAGVHC